MIAPVLTKQTWYVYALCDPDTEIPFYIGKGTGNRIDVHVKPRDLRLPGNKYKKAIIQQIHAHGKEVVTKKFAEFTNEQDAYIYERATILAYQGHLTNIRPGGVGPRQQAPSLAPINGITYYTPLEAAAYLGISRPTFNKNVKPQLPEYKYGALRRVYYRAADVERFRGIRQVSNGDGEKQS